MGALGHFLAFISALAQEAYVLLAHPLDTTPEVDSTATTRPRASGARPAPEPAPESGHEARDDSGSEVLVEIAEEDDEPRTHRDDPIRQDDSDQPVEGEDEEENAPSMRTKLWWVPRVSLTRISHMQMSMVPAIAPVSFAMLLTTLSRALEKLAEGRRRESAGQAGLLLARLRSRPRAFCALTGEMLEALLVTFEPGTTMDQSLVEKDAGKWVDYWWELLVQHLPDLPEQHDASLGTHPGGKLGCRS